jgi:tRNA 2-selenouridine synthase
MIAENWQLVDVRSEIEFLQSHIPGSINIPILNTSEREQVGTAYKKLGPEAAIRLGHELVCGETKSLRVQKWVAALKQTDNSLLTCFRGGMRSQIAQTWCQEAGLSRPRVQGGTKALRSFLIEDMNQRISSVDLLVVTGATGAGKSLLLQDLKKSAPILDLEGFAHHRGSAFGAYPEPQPEQAVFENRIAVEMIRQSTAQKFLVEDESRMIGKVHQPESLFLKLRQSPAVFIDEDLETRTENTYNEYILGPSFNFENYKNNVQKISKKLGGLRTKEVLDDLTSAQTEFNLNGSLELHKVWVRKLLDWYYDPLYFKSLKQRDIRFVFQGKRSEVLDYLRAQSLR